MILFRDSLYYIPRAKIKPMLERYSRYLKPSGVFIVRMWDAGEKYKAILDPIESEFDVIEKCLPERPKSAVMVFRQKT